MKSERRGPLGHNLGWRMALDRRITPPSASEAEEPEGGDKETLFFSLQGMVRDSLTTMKNYG